MMKKLMSRLMRLMVLMMLALATMQLPSTGSVCFWLGGAGWVMSVSVMVLKKVMREKVAGVDEEDGVHGGGDDYDVTA